MFKKASNMSEMFMIHVNYLEAFLLSKLGKGRSSTYKNSRNSQNQGQIYPFLL